MTIDDDRIKTILQARLVENVKEVTEVYHNDYGRFERPTFQSVFMQTAMQFAKRSTCCRLQVGAVIVDQTYSRVLCIGYNGSVPGDLNQCDSLEPGACGCIHAEANAITKASESLKHSILFVTTSPCLACSKLIVLSGVQKVYYANSYRNDAGVKFLKEHGLIVHSWQEYEKLIECDSMQSYLKYQIKKKH